MKRVITKLLVLRIVQKRMFVLRAQKRPEISGFFYVRNTIYNTLATMIQTH